MEHLSIHSLKPDDHNDRGLFEFGPDEDATTLWEQQTERLSFASTPPTRERALAPQQIKRQRAKSQHQRNVAFVNAVSGRPFTVRGAA